MQRHGEVMCMMTDMAARRDGPALGWRRRDVGSEALAGRRWQVAGLRLHPLVVGLSSSPHITVEDCTARCLPCPAHASAEAAAAVVLLRAPLPKSPNDGLGCHARCIRMPTTRGQASQAPLPTSRMAHTTPMSSNDALTTNVACAGSRTRASS
jgi:hypothetical protein